MVFSAQTHAHEDGNLHIHAWTYRCTYYKKNVQTSQGSHTDIEMEISVFMHKCMGTLVILKQLPKLLWK